MTLSFILCFTAFPWFNIEIICVLNSHKWDNPSIFISELLPFFCQKYFFLKCQHATHMLRSRGAIDFSNWHCVSWSLISHVDLYGKVISYLQQSKQLFFKALAFRAGDLDKTIGLPWISLDLSIFFKIQYEYE